MIAIINPANPMRLGNQPKSKVSIPSRRIDRVMDNMNIIMSMAITAIQRTSDCLAWNITNLSSFFNTIAIIAPMIPSIHAISPNSLLSLLTPASAGGGGGGGGTSAHIAGQKRVRFTTI